MFEYSVRFFMDGRSRRQLRNAGMLLLLLGSAAILLPQAFSITLAFLAGILLLTAGGLAAYITWISGARQGRAWIRPLAILALGAVIVLFPGVGTALVGLLLTLFFLFEGIAGISLGLGLRPLPGWGWPLFSGIGSLIIALIFIAGWPFNAAWLVGLLIGLSLLFQGIALLLLSRDGPA